MCFVIVSIKRDGCQIAVIQREGMNWAKEGFLGSLKSPPAMDKESEVQRGRLDQS